MRIRSFLKIWLTGTVALTGCQREVSAPQGETPFRATALSCSSELGLSAASELVKECLVVSPATHPPCNVQNSCEMIRSEIKRGCDYVGQNQPSFCRLNDR